MNLPLPRLDDPEGDRVPAGFEVIDAHVHVFPARTFEAIWRWFEAHAWGIRYKLHAAEAIAFLQARGVSRMTGLHYAHVPGMARSLNQFAAELGRDHPALIPFGTVLPGEPDAAAIVEEAFGVHGLQGIKLHCHVQQFAPNDPVLDDVYRQCIRFNRPLLIHAGREPELPAYPADIQKLCNVSFMRDVLSRFPELTVIVPHLGADEIPGYGELLGEYPNLYLDTTMMVAEYLPARPEVAFLARWSDR
ncbi:MAG: amidohydrolase, partial [Cyanobacteria bacterium RYN_339]|nr:amidohydrolase [Cyanobacteria bacterium RYN_339]